MAIPDRTGSNKTEKSTQEIQNLGFDMEYDVPATVVLTEDDSVTPNVLRRMKADLKLTQAIEYDGNGNPIYTGEAAPGSGKDEAKWRIRKFTYSGSSVTDVQWADGNTDYDNIWDDREELSYS